MGNPPVICFIVVSETFSEIKVEGPAMESLSVPLHSSYSSSRSRHEGRQNNRRRRASMSTMRNPRYSLSGLSKRSLHRGGSEADEEGIGARRDRNKKRSTSSASASSRQRRESATNSKFEEDEGSDMSFGPQQKPVKQMVKEGSMRRPSFARKGLRTKWIASADAF